MRFEQVTVDGFTIDEWSSLLNNEKAVNAQKALDYLDGEQRKHIEKVLQDPFRGRSNWKTKGMTPVIRPITKTIIEKSGMLFKDKPPVLEIFNRNEKSKDQGKTELLNELLSQTEFHETCVNLDQVVRLLKTALLLVQWDNEEQRLVFDVLHRANCEVVLNPSTKSIRSLIYRTSTAEDENRYQIWTAEEVIEISKSYQGPAKVLNRSPNTYGKIPVSVFYDTTSPRNGFWVEHDESIVVLNEQVNLHYTDTAYALMWQKVATPVTNMTPAGQGSSSTGSVSLSSLSGRSTATESKNTLLAGPGEVVVLDSVGIDNPFFDFKSPKVDLVSLDDIVESWVRAWASDWSVRIRTDGLGTANSGFQLIVEDLPNFDLRKARQRKFEQGLKRFYKALASVYNVGIGAPVFDETSDLFAKFNEPKLPVDQNQQEIMWTQRINDGRATPIDYFVQEQGMTEEEAWAKFNQIQEFNAKYKAPAPTSSDQSSSLQDPNIYSPTIVQN